MNENYLDKYYSLLIDFLTRHELENIPEGYEDEKIKHYEIANSVQFPKAYRLFLSKMAKSDLRIFDSQKYTIPGLKVAQETANDLIQS